MMFVEVPICEPPVDGGAFGPASYDTSARYLTRSFDEGAAHRASASGVQQLRRRAPVRRPVRACGRRRSGIVPDVLFTWERQARDLLVPTRHTLPLQIRRYSQEPTAEADATPGVLRRKNEAADVCRQVPA